MKKPIPEKLSRATSGVDWDSQSNGLLMGVSSTLFGSFLCMGQPVMATMAGVVVALHFVASYTDDLVRKKSEVKSPITKDERKFIHVG